MRDRNEQARSEPPIVDTHAHIFTRGLPFAPDAWTRPDYDYPVERYLADLDAHGIAFGVIAAASLFGTYNDHVLTALRAHPRLRGTVRIGLDTDRGTLEGMARQGVVGVRFQWKRDADMPDLGDHDHRKLFFRMSDLGMHAQVNTSGPRLEAAIGALRDCGLPIVIDHFGLLRASGLDCPGFRAAVREAQAGHAWIKLSAPFRLPDGRARTYARWLLREVGPDRLLWGSDAPFVGHEGVISFRETIDRFEAIVPEPAARRRMSDAALKLFFF